MRWMIAIESSMYNCPAFCVYSPIVVCFLKISDALIGLLHDALRSISMNSNNATADVTTPIIL